MVEIIVNGVKIDFKVGNQIDLGDDGLIFWFPKEEAKAVRILQREHQKRIKQAIEWGIKK